MPTFLTNFVLVAGALVAIVSYQFLAFSMLRPSQSKWAQNVGTVLVIIEFFVVCAVIAWAMVVKEG